MILGKLITDIRKINPEMNGCGIVENTKNNAYRIEWIDSVRGIAILMVMCGHVSQPNPISKWYSMFDVAVFLVISGFMNEEKSRTSLTKATARKNILPYLWFSVAAIGVKCLYCILKTPHELVKSFGDYFYRTVVGYGILALWFIPSYLIGQLIYFYIRRNKIGWQRVMFNLLLPVAAFGAENLLFVIHGRTSSFVYDLIYYPVAAVFRGLACGFYIYVGYLIYIAFEKNGKKLSGGGYICLSTAILIMLFPLAQLIDGSNFSMLRYGNHPVLLYVCGILGSIGLMGLCYGIYQICSFRFLEFYGRNSLILMGTHMSLMLTGISTKIVGVVNETLFHSALNDYICAVICTGIMLIIELPIIFLLNGKLRFFMVGKYSQGGGINK